MVWVLRPQRVKRPGQLLPGAACMAKVLCLGLLLAGAGIFPSAFAGEVARLPANLTDTRPAQAVVLAGASAVSQARPERWSAHADFEREAASQDVRHLADWIVDKTDNHKMPFLIVDKVAARVFVFDVAGNLRGAAPALLGMALGDDPIAGIRNLKMADIGPGLRVTPAGRFLASLGHDPAGKEILWVDYNNSIALHAVVTNNPKERRLQRLESPIPLDHRISWGCINVPKKFYESIVSPAFTGTQGVVYVLPETRMASEVFGLE